MGKVGYRWTVGSDDLRGLFPVFMIGNKSRIILKPHNTTLCSVQLTKPAFSVIQQRSSQLAVPQKHDSFHFMPGRTSCEKFGYIKSRPSPCHCLSECPYTTGDCLLDNFFRAPSSTTLLFKSRPNNQLQSLHILVTQ